jgi:hypothetical protein
MLPPATLVDRYMVSLMYAAQHAPNLKMFFQNLVPDEVNICKWSLNIGEHVSTCARLRSIAVVKIRAVKGISPIKKSNKKIIMWY